MTGTPLKKSSLFIVLLGLLLTSCASINQFHNDTQAARDTDKKSFVQKTDGTVLEANEAVLRTPLFGKSTVELDRNTKIPVKEIEAYQNNTAYYRRVNGQFAPRIKKGLINMYRTTETYQDYNGTMSGPGGGRWQTRTRITYHVQKGDSAGVVRFAPDVVRSYVTDYEPAMEYINVYDATRQSTKTWSYINTAATLGGLFLAGAAGVKDDKVTAAGYAGTGLFLGGLASGFVNKIRKGKNGRNLELAIDEYNAQVVKTRRKR